MEILLLITLIFEYFIFIIYAFLMILDLYFRSKKVVEYNDKMINTGRLIAWISVVCIIIVSKEITDHFYLFFCLITILMTLYFIGARLRVLGVIIKEENKDTFYYKYDKILENFYYKYIEPLWPKSKS